MTSHNVMKKYIGFKPVQILIFFLFFFLVMSSFWNVSYFTDEEEIFVKGQQIARGSLLYKDIGSQHMPLMYFLAAFFSAAGVSTITGFRLCFFCLMAIIWTVMFCAYRKEFGSKVLILYPLVYIAFASSFSYGTTVLSEQLQGQGMAILTFELLRFYQRKEIRKDQYWLISLAIFISFGSAFVSAFAILMIFLIFFVFDMKFMTEKGILGFERVKYFLDKYLPLMIVVCIPWIFLLLYFLKTKTLREFYSWAYIINRKVYPEYLGGDYGKSILAGFLGGISNIGSHVSGANLFSEPTVKVLFGYLITILYFIEIKDKKYGQLLGTGLCLFLISLATRGSFNFHGLPFCAGLSVLISLYFSEVLIPKLFKKIDKPLYQGILVLCVIIFFSSIIKNLGNIFNVSFTRIQGDNASKKLVHFIDDFCEDGERVGCSVLNYNVLINAHVLPASVTGGAAPWMWIWGGEQAMKELQNDPPRLFLFNENLNTWNYPIREYAPELFELITDDYTQIKSIHELLYIRNDLVKDLEKNYSEYLYIDTLLATQPDGFKVVALRDQKIKQYFRAEHDFSTNNISVKIGTYDRINYCQLEAEIWDETEKNQLSRLILDCEGIQDNSFVPLNEKRLNLFKDHDYSITIVSPNATSSSFVALYLAADQSSELYCTVDEKLTDSSLWMQIKKFR